MYEFVFDNAQGGLGDFAAGVPAASDLDAEAVRLCEKLRLKLPEQNADLVMQSMVLRAALPQVTVPKGGRLAPTFQGSLGFAAADSPCDLKLTVWMGSSRQVQPSPMLQRTGPR